jgi:hypothetical protein
MSTLRFVASPFLDFLIAAGFAVLQTFFPFRRNGQALKEVWPIYHVNNL